MCSARCFVCLLGLIVFAAWPVAGQGTPRPDGGQSGIIIATAPGHTWAEGLRADLAAVTERLSRAIRELGRSGGDVHGFLGRLLTCVKALEDTAAMLQGGSRALSQAEAATHLDLARLTIERTRLSPAARVAIDEAVRIRREGLAHVRAANECLIGSMVPFLEIVEKARTAAEVGGVESGNLGYLTVIRQLPTEEDVRKLDLAFKLMAEALQDTSPLLPTQAGTMGESAR